MRKIIFIWVIVCLCGPAVRAEEFSSALLSDGESNEMVYINKRTSHVHARASFSIKKEANDRYVLFLEGEGSYDQYADVEWTSEADILQKGVFLHPLKSSTVIRDKTGNTLIEYSKRFDFGNKEILFSKIDGQGNVIQKKKFPLKGQTCDDITLIHCVKPFAAGMAQKENDRFYLLSNEPRLYRIIITDWGEETLDLPVGRIPSVKIQLMADLGPLTRMAARTVPDTYVWYTNYYPYYWVQYEGLETDPESTHLKIELLKRSPAIKKP